MAASYSLCNMRAFTLQMTLVGRIIRQESSSVCITYTVHDGTGSLEGMTYVNDVSDEMVSPNL